MKDLLRADDGVSSVLGAILVVGLVATVFAHVQLHQVPVWEAQAEARFGQEVHDRLAGFQAGLISGGSGAVGVTASLPARPQGQPLGGPGPTAGHLSFGSAPSATSLILERYVDATSEAETPSSWQEHWMETSGPITDVVALHSFRLRVDEVGGQKSGEIRVVAKDASDRYVGNLSLIQEANPPQSNIYVRTTDADEQVLYHNPMTLHLSTTISPYWVDVLDPTFRYDGLLANAAKPLTFEFHEHVLSTQHALSYTTTATNGSSEVVGGAGEPVDVALDFAGAGQFEFRSDRTHLVPQRYLIDHGALVLVQPDGAVFRVPPVFTATNSSGILHIEAVLPLLEGEVRSLETSGPPTLQARPVTAQLWSGLSARMTLNISTTQPGLWAEHWASTFAALGPLGANHTVQLGDTWVRLTVEGPGDPGAPDLSLDIRIPRYRLTLGG